MVTLNRRNRRALPVMGWGSRRITSMVPSPRSLVSAPPPVDVQLLTEIRDLLKTQRV